MTVSTFSDYKWNAVKAHEESAYLAACQLSQVRLQLLSDHRVDGDQAEDAGLPHTALCVVVALKQQMTLTKTTKTLLFIFVAFVCFSLVILSSKFLTLSDLQTINKANSKGRNCFMARITGMSPACLTCRSPGMISGSSWCSGSFVMRSMALVCILIAARLMG